MSQLNNKGSALVTVLAFSIVMAIAAAGYLRVMSTTVSHEMAALDDEKAYYAAESGLQLGIRWLRDTANWNNKGSFATYAYSMNDMTCTLTIGKVTGALDTVVIRSSAVGNKMPYQKVLRLAVLDTSYGLGTFINDLSAFESAVGGGGLNNVVFDGPLHSNVPLILSSVSNPGAGGAQVLFKGAVTVFNDTSKVNFDEKDPANSTGQMANYGESGNNFSHGIYKGSVSQRDPSLPTDELGTSWKVADHFQSSYTHSQEYLRMPRMTVEDRTLPWSPNTNVAGEPPFLLYKSDGSAIYHYYTADGADTLFDTIKNVNDSSIRAVNDIAVLGIVNGQTTLVTDSGFNIYPVGDLKYADFKPAKEADYIDFDNSSNYGVVESSTNIISLVSGADIWFGHTMQRYDSTTRTLVDITSKDTVMYVTASLIAEEESHGTWWPTAKDERYGKIEIAKFNYNLRAIGDRILDEWFNYNAGGTNSNAAINFYFDTRLDGTLKGPDVPDVYAGDPADSTGLRKITGIWTETNIPL